MSTSKSTPGKQTAPEDSDLGEIGQQLRWSEMQRSESLLLFQEAFRSSPAALTIANLPGGELVEVNEAFTTWSGFTRTEALGRTSVELGVWVNNSDRDTFFRKIQTEGQIVDQECLMRSRDGEIGTVLLSGKIVYIEKRPHVLSVSQHITALKESESNLRQALEKEQELRKLKSSFISLVSHEFRTPLGVIYSAAEILESYFDRLSEKRRQDHLGDIKEAAAQMTKLMDGVLTLERSESGKMQFKPSLTRIADLCDRLLVDVSNATQNRCPVELTLPDPPPDVLADETLVRHALSNILTNAIKYSDEGQSVALRVTIQRKWIHFKVTDSGIGIPVKDQAHLFEAFHRADNVGQRSGTGLGLMIVKKCIDLHGGTIELKSDEGKGTEVTIRIPVSFPDSNSSPPE